jgi:Protein of unknown function (DUF3047)
MRQQKAIRESRVSAPPATRRAVLGGLLLSLTSLAPSSARGGGDALLVDPSLPVATAWTNQEVHGLTDYRNVTLDERAFIRAPAPAGRRVASGLMRPADVLLAAHPWLEWTWRVDRVQPSADIRRRDGDDYAAAIFLMFERPNWFRRKVPALAYVWTSQRTPPGEVVRNPYHPDLVRCVVVRSGAAEAGGVIAERRNIVADYRRAFAADPPPAIRAVALWTDNDQTGEPAEAYYGSVAACAE